MRSSSSERPSEYSSRAPALASSRAAWASTPNGSRRAPRKAASSWPGASRRAGSIVGPTRIIGPTSLGRLTASSVTTWQPIEFATNAGRMRPFASTQRPSARASRASVGRPRSSPLSPWPGRSGTNALKDGASARASGSMYAPEIPKP
jgi:hypothetical protein